VAQEGGFRPVNWAPGRGGTTRGGVWIRDKKLDSGSMTVGCIGYFRPFSLVAIAFFK